MSEKNASNPFNNGQTVQKKKSFHHKKSNSNLNRYRKSNSNFKVKPLEQIEAEVGKQKFYSDKIPNSQNNDNHNNPEIEKKEVDIKKNRYHRKKSMNDMKKDDLRSDTVNETIFDITSNNDKPELRKTPSKQIKKKRSKTYINKTEEGQKEDDSDDIKLIDSFLSVLSLKKNEMEKEEEEIENKPQQNKYTPRRQSFSNKSNKPKKEVPIYDDVEIRKVLDCYDFPTSFKTHNLLEIFEEFKGMFRINWINDTRALFVFDTEDHARAALLSKIEETRYTIKPYENPNSDSSSSNSLNDDEDEQEKRKKEQKQFIKQFISTTNTNQATPSTRISQSSQKVQSNQESHDKPVRRQRPVTSDAVARRLIANALGVKPKEKTEEEKEIDRKKFEEARAKRRAERLERQKRLQENSDIFN
jgi:hypothetical protein